MDLLDYCRARQSYPELVPRNGVKYAEGAEHDEISIFPTSQVGQRLGVVVVVMHPSARRVRIDGACSLCDCSKDLPCLAAVSLGLIGV